MDTLDSKKQELLQGLNKDTISDLPEGILHHILSFLPTKYAVGTSILSTRWKYLWTSLPTLDFCDSLLVCSTGSMSRDPSDMEEKFMNFVDRVLLFHEADIHKFCLTCKTAHDASRVNAWISTVIRRKVRNLIIDIILEDSLGFPRCLFSCESLTILKIEMKDTLEIPAWITFPSLKLLDLCHIGFSCDQSIQQVNFRLPVLEEFNMKACGWSEIMTVNIVAPLLERLDIDDHSDFGTVTYGYEMKICAESLKSLTLNSNISCMYSLHNLPLIIDASINLVGSEDIGHSVVELFREICNVKDLTISIDVIEALSANWPKFSKLINLRVITTSDPISGSHLINLLHDTPNIKSLVFLDGLHKLYVGEQFLTLATFPQYFLSNLKSVDLGCIHGYENELSIANFFLKNARVLEKMTIASVAILSAAPKRQMEVSKQLLMLPRVSACCVIDFS